MKHKTIPVILNGRQVQTIDERPPVKTRVYDRWWKLLNIKKVYHVWNTKIVIETKDSLPYEVKA